MRHYATNFCSKFLPQGLALYASLVRHSSQPFRLHVLAMDKECCETLRVLALSEMSVKYHEDIMPSVLRIERTWTEYCWGCASNFTASLMPRRGVIGVTYLDADTFFFSNPEQVFEEIGDKSIAIIPHRFPPERKHMEVNGRFNVSWVTFRGPIGSQCLEIWARQCREKCSAIEGCGDQVYLDSWPSDYPGEVCEIQDIGVGAAPWNLGQYKVTQEADGVRIDGVPLVMYHAHEYIHNKRLTNYKLREEDIKLIYTPYIAGVNAAKERVDSLMMEVK